MRKSLFIVLLGALFNTSSATAQPLRIVVSIKPLALITADIGGEHIEVTQLIPPYRSPHDHAMRMSDRKAIDDASLVLWTSHTLEPFVEKLLSGKPRSLVADTLPGIRWPESESATPEEERDPHIWLNPENAIIIASHLAGRLAELDPGNRNVYNENLARFSTDIAKVDNAIHAQFARLPKAWFVVQHDAYGHFVTRYQLHQLGVLRNQSGAHIGPRTLAQLLARSRGKKPLACVFSDPQFDPAPAKQLADRIGVPVIKLDPLGSDTTLGASSYRRFLRHFASKVVECLSNASKP